MWGASSQGTASRWCCLCCIADNRCTYCRLAMPKASPRGRLSTRSGSPFRPFRGTVFSRRIADLLSRSRLRAGQDVAVNEVRLDSIDGRSIRLSERHPADSDDIWAYDVTVTTPTATATTRVWDSGTQLAKFFGDLADRWKGFDGTKEFDALEGRPRVPTRQRRIGRLLGDGAPARTTKLGIPRRDGLRFRRSLGTAGIGRRSVRARPLISA